jgi:hypothetical protein
MYQIKQVVLLHFEKRQDFNSTISMLKRIGFRAKEGISLPVHTCTTSESGSLSPHGYGPRLSSFTPLHSEGPHLSQSPFSFTSMLNSEVPLSQIQSLGTQYLTQTGKLYQPRISSPLRYAVPISDRAESPPIPPIPNSQPIYPTNFVAMTSLPNYRSISVPNPLSNSWQQPENSPESSGTSCHASLDYSLSPSGSQHSNTSTGSSLQVMDEVDNTFTLQHRQDFRKLMPRTRSLPFVKEKNHKVVKLKPAHKQSKSHNSSRAGCEHKEIFINDSDMLIKEKSKTSQMHSLDSSDGSIAGSQLILRPTLSESTASQAEDTLICRSSFEVAELPTMLITDPTLLERVNQSTSKLLDQYNADISRGCDVATYAEFYLEQIHMVRRDFWLNQLN